MFALDMEQAHNHADLMYAYVVGVYFVFLCCVCVFAYGGVGDLCVRQTARLSHDHADLQSSLIQHEVGLTEHTV